MRGTSDVARAIVPPEPPGASAGKGGFGWVGRVHARATKLGTVVGVMIVLAVLAIAIYWMW